MKNRRLEVIKCPCCGAEFLPGEIYLPKSFLGQPTSVERDHLTSVVTDYFGTTMNPVEHYTCDYCNTPFKVVAKVQFATFEEEEFNFEKEYSTSLKKESLFLSED